MYTVVSCPICKHKEFECRLTVRLEHPGTDLNGNLDDLDFVRNYILFEKVLQSSDSRSFTFKMCNRCGFIFFTPRPEQADLDVKYHLMDEWKDIEYRNEMKGPSIYDGERAREVYWVLSRYRTLEGLTVIDVGGATGYNLKCLVDDNECYVVDYGQRDVINGSSFLCRSAEEIPESMNIDIVLCCHTLEHMVDPVSELKTIRDKMSPGALLYVEVPFGCYTEPEHTNNFLTHLNFFSEGSLAQLFLECQMRLRHIDTKLTTVRWYRWVNLVAVVENVPPLEESIAGYTITKRQINSRYFQFLRSYGFLRGWFDRLIFQMFRGVEID